MRLSWGLLLGVVASTQAGNIVARQDNPTTAPSPNPSSGSGGGSSTASSPSSDTGGGDTTVFVTTTVNGAGSTVHQSTTVSVTSIKTITVTSTNYATTTVTSSDQDTATKIVLVTTTKIVNAKRHLHEVDDATADVPATVAAVATAVPSITGAHGGYDDLRRNALDKRATITSTITVTGGGGATTIIDTITNAIVSTTSTVVQITSFITNTFQANAKTTTTITSTVTETSTAVSTGVSTSTPTGDSNNNGSGNNSGGGGGGLSTGAKAGIGAGVGVAALLAIGALIFCCMRRRRGSSQPDHDDLMGPTSEVPVGGVGSRNSRPMSQGLAAVPGAAPRRDPILPNVTPEGYRGTAMGDGRAGYAKPDPYGSAYASSRTNTTTTGPTRNSTLTAGDQLPRHPTPDTGVASVSPMSPPRPTTAELANDSAAAKWHSPDAAEMGTDNASAAKWHTDNAAEIDGQPAMGHKSGPVFEMP